MKKTVLSAVSVLLALYLSVMSAFASFYDVSEDTTVSSVSPVYYTEDYYPGLISEMRDLGISLFSNASYGSYSETGFNPLVNFSRSGSGGNIVSLNTSEPVVSVTRNSIASVYSSLLGVENISSGMVFFSLAENTYFDFQSSYFVFEQNVSNADTFVLNGTFTFSLQNLWAVTQSSVTSFYGALDPIGIQLLVDGRPFGNIITDFSYNSPFNGAFGGSPANATVTFNGFEVYGVESAPELIGFRIYVSSNYVGSNRSLTSDSPLASIEISNSLRIVSYPSISYVKESTSSDENLSGILDVLNSIYVQLFDSSYSLSWLERIFNQLRDSSNNRSWFASLSDKLTQSNQPLLGDNGAIFSGTYSYSLAHIARNGFLGLATFLRPLESAVNDYVFSWRNYNLDTHSLDSPQSITGQNSFFQNAFQSIEENLGRLTYVFASDDEIELRDEASPSVDQFKESFGGGASASDILEIADSVGEVQGMFYTGFGVNDLWDSLKGESWWSWFTTENALAIDSTGYITPVSDVDPYNMQTYYDHINEVNQIRDREEGK